jgi:hypothetical protein
MALLDTSGWRSSRTISAGVYAADGKLGPPPRHTVEQVMGAAGACSAPTADSAVEMESAADTVLMDMAFSKVTLST